MLFCHQTPCANNLYFSFWMSRLLVNGSSSDEGTSVGSGLRYCVSAQTKWRVHCFTFFVLLTCNDPKTRQQQQQWGRGKKGALFGMACACDRHISAAASLSYSHAKRENIMYVRPRIYYVLCSLGWEWVREQTPGSTGSPLGVLTSNFSWRRGGGACVRACNSGSQPALSDL